MNPPPASALVAHQICKTFRKERNESTAALDGVSVEIHHGSLTALVGPDGAGKTTFLRLACGLISPDSGQMTVLGIPVTAHPQQVQDRIGYMPQRFGLYEDLTVRENLNLYADIHGVFSQQRKNRFDRLMQMTDLGSFQSRLAGRLSGGMKQKLGLACTLIRSPQLLLLDEPTVGVDPLSRRELWDIIWQLLREHRLTVLVSTSYLDEADGCTHVVVLRAGKVLTQGPPAGVSRLADGRVFVAQPAGGQKARDLQAELLDDPDVLDAVPQTGRVRLVRNASDGNAQILTAKHHGMSVTPVDPRFEDGFMVLLRGKTSGPSETVSPLQFQHATSANREDVIVQADDLVRMFGNFTAVDRVSFQVCRGEIFGLLGPNGAGKTTTFRMLCGLLPATSGTLRVAGVDLRRARASARQRIGYVAQKFSLYGQLSVRENLAFFASAYGLRGVRKRQRIAWAIEQFELQAHVGLPSGQLPGGYKQRLAMAAALLHEPETLFLDEPTSGADPLARREFWRRITSLSQQGVTVVITTHFMTEAEYCDRIVIMDAGRVLAQGTPADVRDRASGRGREPTMEDAFMAIVEEARRQATADSSS